MESTLLPPFATQYSKKNCSTKLFVCFSAQMNEKHPIMGDAKTRLITHYNINLASGFLPVY